MLKTKLLIWRRVLQKETNRSVVQPGSRCMMPPDFWCDSTEVTHECFDSSKCAIYKSYAQGRPIRMTLLYATHCPFSQATIVDNFYENLWQNKKLRRFYKIRFLPYGNGKVEGDDKIICQHGSAECTGNTINDCVKAKAAYEETVEYIVCHMREVREHKNDHRAFETCSRKLGWSAAKKTSIMRCASSEEGHRLQLKTANESDNLEPEMKHFVPWLVINGYSTLEMQHYIPDLDKFICRWYYGGYNERRKCNLCDYAPSECK
uniref:Gamma interferon inducible lysosomal thiol reductase GILT n=1 Tax=Ascaris lumbricoides TaxID=6252 RepID=A0A0M3HRM7_ASCLU